MQGRPIGFQGLWLDYRDGKVQIDRFVALGLGWAFVSYYACRVFFSVSYMDVCFDEVVVVWKSRERKGRRGKGRNRRGKEEEGKGEGGGGRRGSRMGRLSIRINGNGQSSPSWLGHRLDYLRS